MSDRIFAATRKGLFTIDRNPATRQWAVSRAAHLGENVALVAHDPRDGHVYAATEHGHFGVKMFRSKDGGDTWESISTPQYPKLLEGVEPEIDVTRKKPIPMNTELVWAIQPGGKDEPGVLWGGTIPGALFKSTDRGDSWSMINSLWERPERKKWFGGGRDWPGIHSICVDPRNSKHLSVAVSCGGVWTSKDGGDSWECQAKGMRAEYMPPELAYDPNIQDPHIMVRSPSRPDTLWVQHHNGVFRTTDNCGQWEEIQGLKPSAFGFAVAVHPKQPDTAWFVPAVKDELRFPVDGKVVVVRTRDGGKSSEILSDGLPQKHAYDLVFRHCLDVDASGDRIAFGSTTGNLWISENQGDRWQLVTGHLPPVYCVRFVK